MAENLNGMRIAMGKGMNGKRFRWTACYLAGLLVSAQAAEKRDGYHLSGLFELPGAKVAGRLEVFGKRPDKILMKVEIPGNGFHLRVNDGARMWHFDPPPGSRAGEGWNIYPRPGYSYDANMAQARLGEVFNFFKYVDGETKAAPDGFLLGEFREFSKVKVPTRIARLENGKTNDIFTVNRVEFLAVADSQFAAPLRVKDWPAGWMEFDEAYSPPSFVKGTWPWKGGHSRFFHDDFGKTNGLFYWSYVVFNALEGDTLKTEAELKDALHRYDASLYGEAFAPAKIKVSVGEEQKEKKLGHEVTRRRVTIDGYDAEAAKKELRTEAEVFRWYCPVANRTGMLVLRSPRPFGEEDEVWRTLLGFWREAECHPEH